MIWKVVSIISFAACMILVALFITIKIRFFHNFTKRRLIKDKLLEKKWLAGNYNLIFNTSGEVSHVINKYIITYDKKKCYLICNYTKQFYNVSMKVFAYNKQQQLIRVIEVNETGMSSHSSVINLPSNCKYVNIMINSVNNLPIKETNEIKAYKKLIKIETLALFFGLLFTACITINVITADLVDDYIKSIGMLITLVPNILICTINYIIISRLFILKKSADLGDYCK